ncbi:MAG: phage terminase large subunit family protein, partial [Pseudomonadota bacterium]
MSPPIQRIRDRLATYTSLESILYGIVEGIRPTEKLTVTQAAERHVMIKEKSYTGPWRSDKAPYTIEPQDMLTSLDHTGMVFVGPARTGKALALDTPIATPTGWTTMGELQIGDRVFDEHGDVCNVTGVTSVMFDRPCYTVHFSDGHQIVADAEHEWVVSDCHRPGKTRMLTTVEMLPTHKYGLSSRNRYSIAISGSLDLADADLPLHPYVLGAWLGDGSSDCASITSGAADAEETKSNIESCGIKCRYGRDNPNGAKSILLSDKQYGGGDYKSTKRARSPVSEALFSLNLGYKGSAKYIPSIYLRASREQRIALLQGLMDTDGHADARIGTLEFCTTSEAIADGFAELITSLGYKFCLTKRPAAKKIAYRFMFNAAPGDVVFRLRRKQARVDANSNIRNSSNRHRYIKAIEPTKSVPVKCIEVDSKSHLYLAGKGMIPTHNSQMWLNWMTHTALYDSADMMLLQMSISRAREFSLSDWAKLFRNSPDVRAKLVPGRQNDNVYDKTFTSGM